MAKERQQARIWALLVIMVASLFLAPRTAWCAPRPVVVVLRIEGTIDLGLAPFVIRSLADAQERGASAVILELDTLGGRLDAGLAIRDQLLDSPLRTVAFVRRRAISAGALIAIAATHLAVAEGATIGAATPIRLQPSGESSSVDEKTVSYVRKEFKATAERRGRASDIAEAMVDPAVEIPKLVEKGKLLTLTAREAIERGFAEYTAEDVGAVLRQVGIPDARVVEYEPLLAERVVRFVTEPILASVLMSLGLLGLLVEIRSPGFGIPGVVGIACLAVVFWGHYLARLAGAEELVLIILGLGLLGLEVLVIPGFGVAGIAGLASLGVGLVLSLVGAGLTMTAVTGATMRFVLSLLAAFAGFVLLMPILPRLTFARRMVLSTTLATDGSDYRETKPPSLIGAHGTALSPLRPAGLVAIGEMRLDAVTEGTFVESGEPVVVIRHSGNRIVVRHHATHTRARAEE